MFHLVQFIDKPDRINPVITARTPRRPQTANRPWMHAFDPRGLPASTGDGVTEACQHLWYIKGQTFGVEFELAAPGVEPDEVPDGEWLRKAKELLRYLREKLGPSKVIPNSAVRRVYHCGNYERWKVEYDSSAGWEVVSPVLKGVAGLEELAAACEALTEAADDLGLYPDHRTGTHVHLGWRARPRQVVRAIQLTHLLGPILRTLVAPSRFADYDGKRYDPATPNEYCMPVSAVYDIHDLHPEETTFDDLRRMADRNGDARTAALNVTPMWDGSGDQVEVRLHSGTTEARKLLPWISLWMRILWAARRAGPDLTDYDLADPARHFPRLDIRRALDVVGLPDEDRRFGARLRQRQKDVFELWRRRPDLQSWLPKSRQRQRTFTPEVPDIAQCLRVRNLGLGKGRFLDLCAEAQECAVWCSLLGEGALPKESRGTILRSAERLREQGWCEYQRLRSNGPLYKTIQRVLDTATRQRSAHVSGWFDIPQKRHVRAFVGVEAATFTPAKERMKDSDWRACVLRTITQHDVGGLSRSEIERATFETARRFYGIQLEYFVKAVSVPIDDAIDGLIDDGYVTAGDGDRLTLLGEISA